jgi:hypothetical protein
MDSGRILQLGLSLLLQVSLTAGCRCDPAQRSGAKKKQIHSSDDSVAGVVEDGEGNLYLAGASGSFRCVVVKCDAKGKVLWQRRLEDKDDPKLKSTRCESIVLAQGGVVVAGHTRSKGAQAIVVTRFEPSGAFGWQWRLPLRVSFFTRVLLLARAQHVLVAASTSDEHHFHAIGPSGAVVRDRVYKGLGFSIRDVLSAGDDGVTAVGRYYPTPTTKEGLGQEDLAIARFDFKGDGWTRRLLGSADAEFGRAVIAVGDHLITAGHRVTTGEGAARRRRLYLTKSARKGDKVVWEKVIDAHRDVRGVGLAPGPDGQVLVIANAVKKPLHAQPKAGAQRILDTAFSTMLGQILVVGADGAVIRTEELDLGASTSLAAITRLSNGTYCVVGKVRPEEQLIRNRIQPHHKMLVLLVDSQGKVLRKQIISSETLERARAVAPDKQGD